MARLIAGAIVVCTGAVANNWDGYLAAAGPTPIRLQWEVPRLDPAKVLPPLQMSDAVATGSGPEATAEVLGPERPASPVPEPEQLVANAENEPAQNVTPITRIEPNLEPAPKQNEASEILPQMLLGYFGRNGTNEVLVPYSVDFTPPVRSPGSGSSATYISE